MSNPTQATDLSARPTGSASETPKSDVIFRLLELANHPETDGEHFRAFMENVRNGIELLERERDDARRERDEWKSSCSIYHTTNKHLDADRSKFLHALKDVVGQSHGAEVRARKIVDEFYPQNSVISPTPPRIMRAGARAGIISATTP